MITNHVGQIQSCHFVAMKAHSQYESALAHMRQSLDLYGHNQPQLFYTNNMNDRLFLENSFPSHFHPFVQVLFLWINTPTSNHSVFSMMEPKYFWNQHLSQSMMLSWQFLMKSHLIMALLWLGLIQSGMLSSRHKDLSHIVDRQLLFKLCTRNVFIFFRYVSIGFLNNCFMMDLFLRV